jgi:regulator of nonsense transcripts 2
MYLFALLLSNVCNVSFLQMLDERSVALLESAFFIVNPPQRNIRKHTKVYSPLEAYIRHLLLVKLTPYDASKTFVTKQILRLPWNVPEIQCGMLVSKYMLKACLSGRCGIISAILAVATTLKKTRREVVVKLVDLVLEELKWSMENPTFRCQQRAIGLARILGQLYLHSLINSSVVFYQLSEFLNLGHEIPTALLEVCERNARYDKGTGDADVFEPVVKFTSAPLITNSIPEDDESEGTDGGHLTVDIVTDKHVETKALDPVPISPFSKFDPRVPCPFDPPAAILRIQLVCNLLESCGPNIVNVTDLPKLQRFLSSFQRYLFTKHSLPPETKFALLDLFDNVESNLKAARKVKDKGHGKKGKSGNYADAVGLIGFERFTTWSAAHDAVIAFEEAETLADRQAQERMLSKAVGDVRNNGGDRANLLLVNRQDELAVNVESYVGSDESTSDEGTTSVSASSSASVDSMEREEADLISQDVDSSEDGHETPGESDSVEQEEGEDMLVNEDEMESDPVVSEEDYQLQLQQEEFEREIRKLTMEALEKGKMAARAGSGGKVAAGMVHASQFVGKKVPSDTGVTKPIVAESDEAIASDFCSGGVTLKLLKRGHKGRLEAKSLLVPEDTSLAQHALKHGDIKAKERDLLKARVLQYEIESSEQSYGNVYMDQAKLQVIRNRPLLMEDIDRNFTGVSKVPITGRSSNGRGRGRGGRTLRFF